MNGTSARHVRLYLEKIPRSSAPRAEMRVKAWKPSEKKAGS